MKRRNNHPALALAVAAVTGLGMTAYTVAQDRDMPGDRQDRQQADRAPGQDQRADQNRQQIRLELPQGIERSDDADIEGVQSTLRDLTNAAFTAGGFDDMVERLVDQDRNRFGEWMGEQDFQSFDSGLESFRSAYEQKYGEALDIDAEAAFKDIQVVQGEITDATLVAGNWPVKATTGAQDSPYDRAQVAGSEQGGEMPDRPGQDRTPADADNADDEDANIENGRNVAIAAIPGPDGKAGLTVSLINEFPGTWKIDIPNSEQPEKIYTRIAERIGKLTENPDSWPAEPEAAEKLLSYEILAAIYGVEAKKSDQATDRARQGMDNARDRMDQDRPDSGSGDMPR